MLGILVAAFLIGAAVVWWMFLRQKLEWINSHALVYVQGADYRYPGLPLGNFGIPMRTKDSNGFKRVEVVFPRLTETGDVEYIYSWHRLQDVQMAKPETIQVPGESMKLADGIMPIIQDHLQIDADITRLHQEYRKVNELADLVSTSNLYASQVHLYERALNQIDNLLRKAQELEQIYVHFIRETLIGLEVSRYDPAQITGDVVIFDAKYKQLKDEYLQMRDAATAYAELTSERLEESPQ